MEDVWAVERHTAMEATTRSIYSRNVATGDV